MPLGWIVNFTARALMGALPIFAVWFVGRAVWLKIRPRPIIIKQEICLHIMAYYLFCLLWITVIRYGIPWASLLDRPSSFTIQLIPLYTTFLELQNGWWNFIYPLIGNIAWFFPFGLLLPFVSGKSVRFKQLLLLSALLSITIETLQWLFMTGIPDVDDIIFNISGACIGFGMAQLCLKRRS